MNYGAYAAIAGFGLIVLIVLLLVFCADEPKKQE